jgi:alpha-beta hydrolase superfamily lysophospholipase
LVTQERSAGNAWIPQDQLVHTGVVRSNTGRKRRTYPHSDERDPSRAGVAHERDCVGCAAQPCSHTVRVLAAPSRITHPVVIEAQDSHLFCFQLLRDKLEGKVRLRVFARKGHTEDGGASRLTTDRGVEPSEQRSVGRAEPYGRNCHIRAPPLESLLSMDDQSTTQHVRYTAVSAELPAGIFLWAIASYLYAPALPVPRPERDFMTASITAKPIWFGTAERPLFGWFHSPEDGRARSGVVLCPPFGREYTQAHYALRLLAERLASLGICTLRFDYDGTGDSAGNGGDPERVPAWLGSITAAMETVQAAGAEKTFVVGMRIGATLAGIVAEKSAILEGLVLWDPVASGKEYLSYQRALSALSLEVSGGDGSVQAPGLVFDSVTTEHLKALDLTTTEGGLAKRVLVLTRPDRGSGRLSKRLDLPHVHWGQATGQAKLMDVGSPYQVLPYDDVERIAVWIADSSPHNRAQLVVPATASEAVVAADVSAGPVVETPMRVGPAGLFGVMTEVPGRSSGPTVVFVSVANEHHVGPNRLWVDLARRWATAGFRSFRLDLSGLGDSPTRHPQQATFVPRAPEAFDDVSDTTRALRPDDPSDVVLVGLCAAGYQVLDSAFQVKPRGVVALNPVISFQPPEVLAGAPSMDPRRRVALARNTVVEAFHADGPLSALRRRFPDLAWRVRALATFRHRPSTWLRELVDQGTDVLLVCGEREARPIRLGMSARTLGQLRQSGRFRFEYFPELEHGLLVEAQRAAISDLVTSHIFSQHAGRSGLRGGSPVSALQG